MLSRRAILCAVTVLATACGGAELNVRPAEVEGLSFHPQVVEFEQDAGQGLSITTDAQGNPHLAYFELPGTVEEQEEAATDPLAPVLPAVGHAHLVDDIWTHSEVAQDQGRITPSSETAIAVDPEGTHHVVWTAGREILYSTDPSGEAEPQVIDSVDAVGLSIWADDKGVPWIAYYEIPGEPEGPTQLVRVATLEGERWEIDTAAEAETSEPFGTGVGPGPDGPIVAYGSSSGTNVTQRQGNFWRSDVVDPDGGLGVSMDLDAEGNPHLAYVTPDGQVRHAHSIGGAPWEISDVGAGVALSTTSIALDDQGVHHIAWQRDVDLAYANNAEGEFVEVPLPPATAGGSRPRLAAAASVYLAWYSPTGTRLNMATYGEDEPLLAVPSPSAPPGGAEDGGGACEPEGDAITLTAAALAWDKDCIAAEAGQPFSIELVNNDSAPHNIGLYTEAPPAGEQLFQSPITGVPGGSAETFDVPSIDEAGDFYFQCDIHPTMSGTFVVAGK